MIYRGQAYVGAFLAKAEKPAAEDSEQHKQTDTASSAAAAAANTAGDSHSSNSSSSGNINHLYDVGTFAQVHTILAGDTTDSAQLLLLGHRRIKREAVVSVTSCKASRPQR